MQWHQYMLRRMTHDRCIQRWCWMDTAAMCLQTWQSHQLQYTHSAMQCNIMIQCMHIQQHCLTCSQQWPVWAWSHFNTRASCDNAHAYINMMAHALRSIRTVTHHFAVILHFLCSPGHHSHTLHETLAQHKYCRMHISFVHSPMQPFALESKSWSLTACLRLLLSGLPCCSSRY